MTTKDSNITFDIDGNTKRPTLFLILLALTAICCIGLFVYRSAILFILMVVFAVVAFVLAPKKQKKE